METLKSTNTTIEPRRHVSPSVLEFRIEMLKLELANERRAHRCTAFRLKEAENTILGYVIERAENTEVGR